MRIPESEAKGVEEAELAPAAAPWLSLGVGALTHL